jgi:hypothetical protein
MSKLIAIQQYGYAAQKLHRSNVMKLRSSQEMPLACYIIIRLPRFAVLKLYS